MEPRQTIVDVLDLKVRTQISEDFYEQFSLVWEILQRTPGKGIVKTFYQKSVDDNKSRLKQKEVAFARRKRSN